MREMSSSAWLRRGSSIVFDQQSLGLLISNGALGAVAPSDGMDKRLA